MAQTITRVAHRIEPETIDTIDVLGPTIQFLTPLTEESVPCMMRGTIPAGVFIPLHSHADPETFLVLSGEVEGLAYSDDDFTWIRIQAGDVFHVPGGAKHGFRNRTQSPAIMIIVSTSRIGRFFRELGVPVIPGAPPRPPSPEVARRFLDTAARYGYWNASPEENARVGISLPPA
jgi:quercetin dioxygenase-like cupin family protein